MVKTCFIICLQLTTILRGLKLHITGWRLFIYFLTTLTLLPSLFFLHSIDGRKTHDQPTIFLLSLSELNRRDNNANKHGTRHEKTMFSLWTFLPLVIVYGDLMGETKICPQFVVTELQPIKLIIEDVDSQQLLDKRI